MDEYYGMGIISQLFKKVNRKQFYGTVPGEPGRMLGTIAPLVSRSPLARVERGPRLCRVLFVLLCTILTGTSAGPISAHLTLLFTSRIPALSSCRSHTPSLLHCPSLTIFSLHLSPECGFVHCSSSPAPEQCQVTLGA